MTPRNKRNAIIAAVEIGSALLLVGAAALGWISFMTAMRVTMAIIGLTIVVRANSIPKEAPWSSAEGQAVRRVRGWATVIAGFGYAAAWLFAPIELAALASVAAVLAACGYTFLYRRWLRSKAH